MFTYQKSIAEMEVLNDGFVLALSAALPGAQQ
jgi:hypothetical protein